jgi:hypothetical protein
MMTLLMEDCRKDLDDCLNYLAEGWLEELDIAPEDMNTRLETVAPDIFEDESADRADFEKEYLGFHRWFREHKIRVPNAEWRAGYVEDIIGLRYTTSLGD